MLRKILKKLGQGIGFLASIAAFALTAAVIYPVIALNIFYEIVYKAWATLFAYRAFRNTIVTAENLAAAATGSKNNAKVMFDPITNTLNQVSPIKLGINAIIQTVTAPFVALASAIPFTAFAALVSSTFVYFKIAKATDFTAKVQSEINHSSDFDDKPNTNPSTTYVYHEPRSPTLLNSPQWHANANTNLVDHDSYQHDNEDALNPYSYTENGQRIYCI